MVQQIWAITLEATPWYMWVLTDGQKQGRNILSGLTSTNLKTYSLSQLALRNGNDKPEIWRALNGLIYDLTNSKLWRNGKHYEHWASQDLTAELADAPHTANVFDKFEVVGKVY